MSNAFEASLGKLPDEYLVNRAASLAEEVSALHLERDAVYAELARRLSHRFEVARNAANRPHAPVGVSFNGREVIGAYERQIIVDTDRLATVVEKYANDHDDIPDCITLTAEIDHAVLAAMGDAKIAQEIRDCIAVTYRNEILQIR